MNRNLKISFHSTIYIMIVGLFDQTFQNRPLYKVQSLQKRLVKNSKKSYNIQTVSNGSTFVTTSTDGSSGFVKTRAQNDIRREIIIIIFSERGKFVKNL